MKNRRRIGQTPYFWCNFVAIESFRVIFSRFVRKKNAVNVENSFKSVAGQLGRIDDQTPFSGVSGEKQPSAAGRVASAARQSLTVRTTPGDGVVATRRIDSADAEDALKKDALDALIKSALNFPPPPMPNFDIMSSDSA